MTPPYTGRLAPSPTGLLHLGHAATFYAAYQRAQAANGTLLLRNEDLDPERSRPEYVSAMLEDLAWLGIAWTPPMLSQSTRLAAYRAAFSQLLASGHIYPCTCSRRDLAQSLHAPHEADPDPDDEPIYNGRCRPKSERPKSGCPTRAASPRGWGQSPPASDPTIAEIPAANYRFRVPDGETIHFPDANLGPQSFTAGCTSGADFGDFLIWRKPLQNRTAAPHLASEMWVQDLGLPSYQLACVIDDAHQHITEVVRGADLLKSTARQILLQRALNLPTPAYFHTALLRDQHGVRLAKRHDALAIRTLRHQGLTPADVLARIAIGTL